MKKIRFKRLPCAIIQPRDLIMVKYDNGTTAIIAVEGVTFRVDSYKHGRELDFDMRVTLHCSDGNAYEGSCDPSQPYGKIWLHQSFGKMVLSYG